jgi:hypothetical protein
MIPMPMPRKMRKMEKVENICRTATVQKILSTRRNNSDHAYAMPRAPTVSPHGGIAPSGCRPFPGVTGLAGYEPFHGRIL